MKMFRRRQAQTLSEWLEVATRKLVAPARERIRVEIEAHYAEAVEALLESGLSEAAATAKAVAELGTARAAAKRFRKEHLTEWEEQLLEWTVIKQTRNAFYLAACYLTFAVQIVMLRPGGLCTTAFRSLVWPSSSS
jgi:hypothetical protein